MSDDKGRVAPPRFTELQEQLLRSQREALRHIQNQLSSVGNQFQRNLEQAEALRTAVLASHAQSMEQTNEGLRALQQTPAGPPPGGAHGQ